MPLYNMTDRPYKIIGYYTAWSIYDGFTPDQIDGKNLTHINYAFANIGPDLKITLGYPVFDPVNFYQLNLLKRKFPHLKTLISVGGWTWSGRFSDVALTDKSRTVFADSCVDFILKYGFDGIDIDWEYPVKGGLASNIRRPEDKQNFTLLLRKLREKLNKRGSLDKKNYILSIAGGSGDSYIRNTQLDKIHRYVDYACIMTYDMHGTWDAYTDLNAPLFTNDDVSPQYKWSVKSAVDAWVNASFPRHKIVLGIPFYGYIYSSVKDENNGLYQPYNGANMIIYRQIVSDYLTNPNYVRYFHPQSKVPWLFNGSVFISYDDMQSIGEKVDFVKANDLAGIAIWELSQDLNGELLNSIAYFLDKT